jgi:RNA polymerase sigma-70 factor, ECF subfamily
VGRYGCAPFGRLAYSTAMSVPGRAAAPVPDADDEADDEALMLAYAAGDAPAFDALYARHRGGVYRYLVRQCGSTAADELFQDVWMSVIRARGTYAPTAKFATFLYRIAHNRLVDHWRANGHRGLLVVGAAGDPDADDDPLAGVPAPSADEPEARASLHELGERLRDAVASLPAAQREAFLLQHEGGLSLAEIAELTGAGVETVKSRLRYALDKLRAVLAPLREDLR